MQTKVILLEISYLFALATEIQILDYLEAPIELILQIKILCIETLFKAHENICYFSCFLSFVKFDFFASEFETI